MPKKYLIIFFLLTTVMFFLMRKYYVYIKPALIDLYNEIRPQKEFNKVEEIIFEFAFKDQLVTKSIFPEIKTLEDFERMFQTLRCSDVGLDSVYDAIEIESEQQLKDHVVKISYNIKGQKFETYCYYHPMLKSSKNASFIIPESGSDVGWKMEHNAPIAGSKLDDFLSNYSDTYILIKPNESQGALHWNGKKMNYEFIYAKLINEGRSYSKLYMQHAIAVVKRLKVKHKVVATFGLSQGGYANVIVSEFSNPTYAWICSGYSRLYDKYYWAGTFSQITGPGFQKFFNSKYLKEKIASSNTEYYFSYGKNDADFYNFEYRTNYTKNFLNDLKNTNFVYFNGSHNYPIEEIEKFVKINFKN